MIMDKNIIKGNRFTEPKVVKKLEFYGIVDIKVKQKIEGTVKSKMVDKSVLVSYYGSRLDAKNYITKEAKLMGGTLYYFGAFKN